MDGELLPGAAWMVIGRRGEVVLPAYRPRLLLGTAATAVAWEAPVRRQVCWIITDVVDLRQAGFVSFDDRRGRRWLLRRAFPIAAEHFMPRAVEWPRLITQQEVDEHLRRIAHGYR